MAERDRNGFTLLEALVALTILSFVLGVVLVVFSDAGDSAAKARAQAFAETLATSAIDRVGQDLPLTPGLYHLPNENGFRRSIEIDPYGNDADHENWPVAAYTVTVEIAWGEPGAPREYSITTLRLGPKETP